MSCSALQSMAVDYFSPTKTRWIQCEAEPPRRPTVSRWCTCISSLSEAAEFHILQCYTADLRCAPGLSHCIAVFGTPTPPAPRVGLGR